MNKITKAGVEAPKFTVLDTNDAAAFSISASTPTETVIRAKEITINAETITVPEVHVQNVLESVDIATDRIEANIAHIDELTISGSTTGNTIKATNIEAADSLYFYPTVSGGGRSLTPVTVHSIVESYGTAIDELANQTERTFNKLSVLNELVLPEKLTGKGTGSISDFNTATINTINAVNVSTTDLTADAINTSSVTTDSIIATQVDISAAKVTGTLNCKNIQSTGTITTTGAVTASGRISSSEVRTETIRPTDADVGLTIMGSDSYSYIWQSFSGLNVKNTQAIKFELDQLNGFKSSVAITPDGGITLKENNIVIPNAASAIHSLTQLLTDANLADLNAIEQQIEQLKTDVDATLAQAYLTTLLEVPTSLGNFEIVQCSTRELAAGTGLKINRVIITAKNTNTTPIYMSVYKVKSGTKTLLSVSDEPVTWSDGEKVEWVFDETPFTVEAGTDYLTLQLILEKNAPDTVVTSAALQFRTFLTSGYSNCRSQDRWNNGRTPYIKFAGYGSVGQLVEDMQSAQSQIAALVAEDVKLQQEIDTAGNGVAALQTDINLLNTSVTAQAEQIEQLQEKVNTIISGEGDAAVTGYGIERGSSLLYIADGADSENKMLCTSGINSLEIATDGNFSMSVPQSSLAVRAVSMHVTAQQLFFGTRINVTESNASILFDVANGIVSTRCVYVNMSGSEVMNELSSLDSDGGHMAINFKALASGVKDLRLAQQFLTPYEDMSADFANTGDKTLLLYNNCVNDVGVLTASTGTSPIKILKMEVGPSFVGPLMSECELWFETRDTLPAGLHWPSNVVWMSVMPILEQNKCYRLAVRKEPDYGTRMGPLMLKVLYSYDTSVLAPK